MTDDKEDARVDTMGTSSDSPTAASHEVLGTSLQDWRSVALRVGEELARVGPDGYYALTPEQWRDWALTQARRLLELQQRADAVDPHAGPPTD